MAVKYRKDIAQDVASRLGGSQAQGRAALDAVLASLDAALDRGDKVNLRGFGCFEVRIHKRRRFHLIGRPSHEMWVLPEHTSKHFKAARHRLQPELTPLRINDAPIADAAPQMEPTVAIALATPVAQPAVVAGNGYHELEQQVHTGLLDRWRRGLNNLTHGLHALHLTSEHK